MEIYSVESKDLQGVTSVWDQPAKNLRDAARRVAARDDLPTNTLSILDGDDDAGCECCARTYLVLNGIVYARLDD